MTDLDNLITEAKQYGELEKVAQYERLVTEVYPPFHAFETQMVKERADAALAEALALVVKQGRMLRMAFDQLPDDGLEYSDTDFEMWRDGLKEE